MPKKQIQCAFTLQDGLHNNFGPRIINSFEYRRGTKWALVQTCSRLVTPRGKSGTDISLYLLCIYSIAKPYWPGGLIIETAFEENSIQHNMDLSDIAVIQNSRNNLQHFQIFAPRIPFQSGS